MIYDTGSDLNIPQIYFNGSSGDSNCTGSYFCETGSEIFITGNGSYGSFKGFNALKRLLRAQKRKKTNLNEHKNSKM